MTALLAFASSRWGFAAAGALACVLMYAAWSIQVANLRGDIIACRDEQRIAKEATEAEQRRVLAEGREAALKEGERLRGEAAERQKQLETTIAGLRGITKRLEAPQPPITVTTTSEPPIVITPAAASCALDRGTLDELQGFLNTGGRL